MRLHSIHIQNYRSIKSLQLSFEQGCQVLLGVNECGKSNILKALGLLDPESNLATTDVRLGREDEGSLESSVRFVFDFTKDEIDEIYDAVKVNFTQSDLEKPILQKGEKKIYSKRSLHRNGARLI